MHIPELTYIDELDTRVYRETTTALGDAALSIAAFTMTGKPRPNEDAFGFARQDDVLLAGVFDGAVGREVSNLSRHYLEDTTETTAKDALSRINAALGAHELHGGGSTGTIIEIRGGKAPAKLNIAHVSDSWALLKYPDGTIEELTTDQHAPFDKKALTVLARVAKDEGISLSSARHHPEVEEALQEMFRTSRNTPDGSGAGILNGSPHMDQYIQTLPEDIDLLSGTELLIGSDGAMAPGGNNLVGFRRMFRAIRDYGIDYYLNYVHVEEANHPPTIWSPRWSMHDDKSLIAIRAL